MTKKQIKEDALKLVESFQHQHFNCSVLVAKEIAIKSISQTQNVLIYFPPKDRYGFDWMEYYKKLLLEIEKI